MASWSEDEVMRMVKTFRAIDPADPRSRKQRRILDSATELFLHHGYRKTNIDDVARVAGVAKGTVYLYFKTKSDLLMQAVLEEKLRMADAWKVIFDPSLAPRDRLRTTLKMAFEVTYKMPLGSRLAGGDPEFVAALEEIDPEIMKQTQGMQLEMMAEIIAAAIGEPVNDAIRERAKVLRGMLFSTTTLTNDMARQGLTHERHAQVLADMLVDGFASPTRGGK
jgi:AcrR family transcriptional regulator